MSIRDALAAEGDFPLVFMGGTCAGPKWREKLAGQVHGNFRWFNPVVSEWTTECQEVEIAVRADADVLLYCITPYQEGMYSFLEMTEDAIRSQKTVVVCFLPMFEDKSFSEVQWQSLMAAKHLLERHEARVLLSMEDLIDWFSKYKPEAPDSKMLDAQELIRKAQTKLEQKPKPEPGTAPGIGSVAQDEKAAELTPPAKVEPGTVKAGEGNGAKPEVVETDPKPATESYADSNISMEGLFSGMVAMFKGYTKTPPGDKDAKGNKIYPSSWVNKQIEDIKKTYGNIGWVKHNLKHPVVNDIELARRFTLDGKIVGVPTKILESASAIVTKWVQSNEGPLKSYHDAMRGLERDAEQQVKAGTDSYAVAKATLTKAKAISLPFKRGASGPVFIGDFKVVLKSIWDTVDVKSPTKLTNGTLPELTAEEIVKTAEMFIAHLDEINKLDDRIPQLGSGCDSGVWETDGFNYDEGDIQEELYDLFYFQSRPGGQRGMMHDYFFAWEELMYYLGQWLHKACS